MGANMKLTKEPYHTGMLIANQANEILGIASGKLSAGYLILECKVLIRSITIKTR